jgi:hypothetical protein
LIACAVRRYGFLLRTLPPNICRPYLATAYREVRYTIATHRVICLTVERASHLWKCSHCNAAPPHSCEYGSSSMVLGTYMSGERSTVTMFMDHTPAQCMCHWYVLHSATRMHDRVVYVLEEFMLEARATKGRDMRLVVRCIQSGASRD